MAKERSVSTFYQKMKSLFVKKEEAAASHEEPFTSSAVAFQCEGFFNYTVFLPNYKDNEEDVFVIGQFTIKNTGTLSLHHPLLCIRLEPASSARLGGKIAYHGHLTEIDTMEQWMFVHEDWKEKVRETGEYWLKPNHCTSLAPGETLVFSNFELKMNKADTAQLTVAEGFVYAQELREGIASANTVAIHF